MELLLTETTDADNPIAGDLYLRNGNFVWTTDLAEETAQRLRVRFQFFQAEWFLNKLEGTPWFQQILEKGVSESTVKAITSKVITGTEGIRTLDSLDYILDAGARSLVLEFTATLQDGSTFDSKDFPPFIMEF